MENNNYNTNNIQPILKQKKDYLNIGLIGIALGYGSYFVCTIIFTIIEFIIVYNYETIPWYFTIIELIISLLTTLIIPSVYILIKVLKK